MVFFTLVLIPEPLIYKDDRKRLITLCGGDDVTLAHLLDALNIRRFRGNSQDRKDSKVDTDQEPLRLRGCNAISKPNLSGNPENGALRAS